MSAAVKNIVDGKKSVKSSLANKAKGVGSPESKPADPADPMTMAVAGPTGIESEKTKSDIPGDVGTSASDQISSSFEYKTDIKAMVAALWAVEGGEADVADRRGELVHPIIMKLRDGHYGKMANGTDPFKKLANEPGCPISAKQIRRIFKRWDFAMKVHNLGEKHPRLGPALYDATACEKDTMRRLRVLRKSEAQHLNLAETRALARKSAGIVERTKASALPQWQYELRRIASEAVRKLTNAHDAMDKAKGHLDDDDRHILDELFAIIDLIRGEVSHEQLA